MEGINIARDYSIIDIMSQFKKHIKHKNDAFGLLLKLKQSLEFNATIDWKKLFVELGDIYNNNSPLYNNAEYTSDPIDIDNMGEFDIFVFGSNTQGKHDGGAAKAAMKLYDAVYGQARGLQGQSYAIVTLDYTGNETVDLNTINKEIDDLIEFALDNEHLTFWVTKIGTGISGYTISDIAKLFSNRIIPSNVVLPKEFTQPHLYEKFFYSDELNRYFHLKSENTIIAVDIDSSCIDTIKIENARNALSNDIIVINEEDFVIAAEQVLKKMF